jgi:hypothetical protein
MGEVAARTLHLGSAVTWRKRLRRCTVINKLVSLLTLTFLAIGGPHVLAASYGDQHDKVTALFKSSTEPTSKDALWTSKNIFKVGVIDNGSKRHGYASYVCEVLYDYGFAGGGVWVQVIDIAELTRSGKWVKLGEARCK